MKLFYQLSLLFFLFSFLGWVMEVVLVSIEYRRLVNRGFLLGPWCPIYGCGVTFVTIVVGGLLGYRGTWGDVFLAGFFLCGGLEYFTSWYLEKLFHARWWDYSKKPMNLHGRVWIGNLILFGLASAIIVRVVDPFFFSWVSRIPLFVMAILVWTLWALFVCDCGLSFTVMNLLKKHIDTQKGDNTEEIAQAVRQVLRDKRLLRRLLHAYPHWQARPHALTLRLKKARQEYKRTLSALRKAQKQALHSTREELEKAMEQVRQARAEKGKTLRRLRLVQRLFLRRDEEEGDKTGNH